MTEPRAIASGNETWVTLRVPVLHFADPIPGEVANGQQNELVETSLAGRTDQRRPLRQAARVAADPRRARTGLNGSHFPAPTLSLARTLFGAGEGYPVGIGGRRRD